MFTVEETRRENRKVIVGALVKLLKEEVEPVDNIKEYLNWVLEIDLVEPNLVNPTIKDFLLNIIENGDSKIVEFATESTRSQEVEDLLEDLDTNLDKEGIFSLGFNTFYFKTVRGADSCPAIKGIFKITCPAYLN